MPPTLRSRTWVLAVVLLLLAFAIPLCRRSITLADEGYLLMQSLDMLGGKVLYRDMDAFVTPGIWILLAATFELLQPSVLASRAPVLIALLAMYGVGYKITAEVADRRYGLLCVGLLVVMTVWAFPAWTFAFYSPFAVTFALFALDRILAWRRAHRRRDLVLAGVHAGLAITFKQNYGVFAALGGLAALYAVRLELRQPAGTALRKAARDAVHAAVGVALVGLPLLAYYASEGALPALWQSLVVQPFEFSGRHDIGYLPVLALFAPGLMESGVEMLTYAAQPIYRVPPATGWLREWGIVERLHVPLYWMPPVVLALGLALSYRPDPIGRQRTPRPVDAGLFAIAAVAATIFLGVFPRADFNHLINVYQPIVIAGVVVAHHLFSRGVSRASERSNSRGLARRAATVLAWAVVVPYVLVAGHWYWGLLRYLDTEVKTDRARVLANVAQAKRIDYQVGLIREATQPGEAVLTLPDLAMLNFLADRPVPSAYYNLYEHHIAHDGGAAVVAGAERTKTRLAVTRFNNFFSDRVGLRDYAPELARYLSTHFDLRFTVGREDFIVFERREQPAQLPRDESILPFCDTEAGYQRVREHLLFPALYHDPGTGSQLPAVTIATRCRIPVPAEGASLHVRVGYRAPALVQRDTTLTTEIVAAADDELLFRRVFRVRGQPPDRYRKPPYTEVRVDLARYAGGTADLILRTTRRGKVLVQPLEQRGFGTAWEDPRLVPGPAAGS